MWVLHSKQQKLYENQKIWNKDFNSKRDFSTSFMTYLQYLNHFHAIFVKWDKTRKYYILNFQPLLVTKTDFLMTISIQYQADKW